MTYYSKKVATPGKRKPILPDESALLISLADKGLTLMSIWSAMRQAGFRRDRENYKNYLLSISDKYQYLRGKPIRGEEGEIIRECAAKGFALPMIAAALAARGYRRKPDTIGGYMRANDIKKAAICAFDAQMKKFEAAWLAAHPGQIYRDEPRAAWKSRVTQPRPVRDYGINHLTAGGVAVYG